MKKNKALPGSHWYSYVFLYGLLKPFLFIYFLLFQNVHFKRNHFKIPKGPILFIGNHHTNWDGFYHAVMFYRRFPHYIVHDEAFKNERFAWVFGSFLGQIKRGRSNADLEPIIQFKRLIQAGQSVNVYPEGDIHMFGRTLPIDNAVAKMVRLLDIPVVITRVRGAHLRAPRWSNKAHHSRITYEVSSVLLPLQFKTMATHEIYDHIVQHITINSYDDQLVNRTKLWGGHRAEWLELGLYYCPQCQQYETLTSHGNDFICINCGMTGHVNCYLELEIAGQPQLTRPDIWDDSQLLALKEKIAQADESEHLFTLSSGMYEMVDTNEFFSKKGSVCNSKIYCDKLEIIADNKTITIMMQDIITVALQYKDVFEIATKTTRYRLYRHTPKWSAYLWVNCVKIITRL